MTYHPVAGWSHFLWGSLQGMWQSYLMAVKNTCVLGRTGKEGIMFLLSVENRRSLWDPYISYFTPFLTWWSSLKELVPNLKFIHSVLATDVKCSHEGSFHLPQKPGKGEQSLLVLTFILMLKQASKQMQVWRSGWGEHSCPLLFLIWDLILLVRERICLVGVRKDRNEEKGNFQSICSSKNGK